jgi:drug/metabolite transporter (DMT)-like permease
MPHRFLPPILLLLAALCWSLGGVLIKSIDWPPMAIAGGRSAIAIPMILLCIGRPRFTFSRVQIGGALGYAGTVVLFVFATRMTTAANAIFLQYTAPIYVALIGRWYLGERASRIDWLVIAVAMAGIALFFLDRLTLAGLWGNIIALGSGLAFASVALFLRKEKAGSPVASIVLGNVIVALAGAPFIFQAPSLEQSSLWRLALLGTVQLGLPYVLYATAIKLGQRTRSDTHPVARAGLESALGHACARGTARPVGHPWRASCAGRGSRPGSDDDANQATHDSFARLMRKT